ncbi:hypothetical protein D3C71_1823800 [compost metagenome]
MPPPITTAKGVVISTYDSKWPRTSSASAMAAVNGPIAARKIAPAATADPAIRISDAPASVRARRASPAPNARDTSAAPPTVTPMHTDVIVNCVIDPNPTAPSTASSFNVPR